MMVLYLVLLVMTCMGAVASLFLKRAAGEIKKLVVNVNFYVGGLLYFCSAVLNIWILRYMDYSIVLPLTSLTYIWTMVLSHWILKEKISKKKISGVALILMGAIFVSV